MTSEMDLVVMADRVHYIPTGLGTEHLIRPLVRGELDVDRVVLLEPATIDNPLGITAATESQLENTLGLTVGVERVDTTEFAIVTAKAYEDLLADLKKGNEVCINVASPYWSLGAGYATAAHYLLAELTQASDDQEIPNVPSPGERISLYYTEPSEYRIAELIQAAQRIREFRTDFEELGDTAEDLRSDVESDKQTVRSIVELLDTESDGSGTLQGLIQILDAVELESADEDGIARGIDEIVTGIDAVTTGLDILAREKNRAEINSLPFLGPMTKLTEGLAEVSDRTEDSSEGVTTAALLEYFAERLDDVHHVLQRIDYLQSNFDNKFAHSTDEFAAVLDDVEAQGIAQGARTYGTNDDESHSAEAPGPLQFGLSSIQRTIIYTLATTGSADSVQQFTMRLIQAALKTAEQTGLTSPNHAGIDAIRTGDFENSSTLLKDVLLPAIQSKVQYNLTSLETDGFIRKTKFGQTTGIKFTQAGYVYAQTQSFDQNWRKTAFESLCTDITNACND
jgi:hypothetical protein